MGQSFLRDKNVLAKIILAAELKTGDRVLEVGPGLGVLTEELAKHADCVIAVEKDKNLAAQLKGKFAGNENVEIIEGDILKIINHKSLFLNHSYKVVANIPYYLTSHLIRLLLEATNPPQDIILLIQKEVAKRICAKPPKMSLLAVSVQFYAQPKIISYVSKNAFWPKPKVDSAIIKITPRKNEPLPLCKRGIEGDLKNGKEILPAPPFTKEGVKIFFKVVKAGFSQPRKQLLNNLSVGLKLTKIKTADLLQSAGLKPEQRAETLTINDWIKIAETLRD